MINTIAKLKVSKYLIRHGDEPILMSDLVKILHVDESFLRRFAKVLISEQIIEKTFERKKRGRTVVLYKVIDRDRLSYEINQI